MGYPTLPKEDDLLTFLLGNHKLLGPYNKDNGRQFVIVHNYKYTKTLVYARYLWIMHYGELIPDGFEIDHIDDDYRNNNIENLHLLTTDQNNRKRDIVYGYNSDGYTFNCPVCGVERTIPQWVYNQNNKDKDNGPYCSRSCANKTTHPNWGSKAGDANHVS